MADITAVYAEIQTERRNADPDDRKRLTPRQLDLATCMSCISEEDSFAGWLHGLEYRLWAIAMEGAEPESVGMHAIAPEWLQVLRELSAEVGGWIVWRDERDGMIHLDQWGCYFVTLGEWAGIRKDRGAAWLSES